ncbi:hypothetical protein Tco_0849817 [Tanacetum coccineum]
MICVADILLHSHAPNIILSLLDDRDFHCYGDEVVVESEVTDKAGEKINIVEEAIVVTDAVTILVSAATITNVELTLAQTLEELKRARPKTKGVVMQEPSESNPIISLQLPSQVKSQGSKDKGKALLTGILLKKEPLTSATLVHGTLLYHI